MSYNLILLRKITKCFSTPNSGAPDLSPPVAHGFCPKDQEQNCVKTSDQVGAFCSYPWQSLSSTVSSHMRLKVLSPRASFGILARTRVQIGASPITFSLFPTHSQTHTWPSLCAGGRLDLEEEYPMTHAHKTFSHFSHACSSHTFSHHIKQGVFRFVRYSQTPSNTFSLHDGTIDFETVSPAKYSSIIRCRSDCTERSEMVRVSECVQIHCISLPIV